MGFTGNGINDLINKLDKIAEAAEELDGEHSVPLSELFNQDFFAEHSKLNSFDEFAKLSTFDFSDLEAIDESKLDIFIAEHTSFNSWEEMKSSAVKAWAEKKLGF